MRQELEDIISAIDDLCDRATALDQDETKQLLISVFKNVGSAVSTEQVAKCTLDAAVTTANEFDYMDYDIAGELAKLASMRSQNKVAQLTIKRGYRDGWTDNQFAARQVAKLIEEVAELADDFDFQHPDIYWKIQRAGEMARRAFDNKSIWSDSGVLGHAIDELADILVVVFNLADAIGKIRGKEVNIIQMAIDKASSDVKRGVR